MGPHTAAEREGLGARLAADLVDEGDLERDLLLFGPTAHVEVEEQLHLLVGDDHRGIELGVGDHQGLAQVQQLLAIAFDGHLVQLDAGDDEVGRLLLGRRVGGRHLDVGRDGALARLGRHLRRLHREVLDGQALAVVALHKGPDLVSRRVALGVEHDLDRHGLARARREVGLVLGGRAEHDVLEANLEGSLAGLLVGDPLLVAAAPLFGAAIVLGPAGFGALAIIVLALARSLALAGFSGAPLLLDARALRGRERLLLPAAAVVGASPLAIVGAVVLLDHGIVVELHHATPQGHAQRDVRGLRRRLGHPELLEILLVRLEVPLQPVQPVGEVLAGDADLEEAALVVLLVQLHQAQGHVPRVLGEALDGPAGAAVLLGGPPLDEPLHLPAGVGLALVVQGHALVPPVDVPRVDQHLAAVLEDRKLAPLRCASEHLRLPPRVEVGGFEVHEQRRVEVDEGEDLGLLLHPLAVVDLGRDAQGGDAVAHRVLDLLGVPTPVPGVPAQDVHQALVVAALQGAGVVANRGQGVAHALPVAALARPGQGAAHLQHAPVDDPGDGLGRPLAVVVGARRAALVLDVGALTVVRDLDEPGQSGPTAGPLVGPALQAHRLDDGLGAAARVHDVDAGDHADLLGLGVVEGAGIPADDQRGGEGHEALAPLPRQLVADQRAGLLGPRDQRIAHAEQRRPQPLHGPR